MDLDIPPIPDRLLTDVAEALHEACCGGDTFHDPRLTELDQLGHRHDALVVLDTVHAELHDASLRWAAARIRAECSIRGGDDCCIRCATSAGQLEAWADTGQRHPRTDIRTDI